MVNDQTSPVGQKGINAVIGNVIITISFEVEDRIRWAKSANFSFSMFAMSFNEAMERAEQVADMLALPVSKVTIESVQQEVDGVD